MTKEEIIEMAREAGGYYSKKYPDEWRLDDDDLVRFAKLIAEKEREECAKEIEDKDDDVYWISNYQDVAKICAEVIRARGQIEQ